MMRDEFGRIYLGDIITKIGSSKVTSLDDIYHALDDFKIGDEVKVEFLRDGKKKSAQVTLQAL